MKSILCVIIIFLGFLSTANAQTIPKELLGKWIVRRELPAMTISCWGEDEARKLIGTELEYSSEAFRWQTTLTTNPRAETTTVTASQFHDDNSGRGSHSSQVTFSELGIKAGKAIQVAIQHAPATLFEATGEIPGDNLLIKDKNTIIFSVCNVYFEAKRALAVGSTYSRSNNFWFHERITWQAGSDPRPWETVVVSPDGKERFRLALVPLWAVEGGIVAMQIVVARPDEPNKNLLGDRNTDGPMTFVITVRELQRGIKKSKFGTVRNFYLKATKLRVEILGSRLGTGVGECLDCPNIQEFAAILSLRDR